ncbi:alpha/beta fold hydrolase [Henriciella pelagia]|jgi:pimeloyl-ACP methyl ester carboxylesterase|uniref:Epoxide hydrolase n=1 Tax=Henriciella pelagia TaxID=1977912 RepID=A0ABQ1JA44_9PROT|nr:alpha/beta hydrolase [Henriciella pelagia]GGB62355.1 epoxide hydrolase [Henriciella pelagia]
MTDTRTEPTLRTIKVNGINMRIAEMGQGPLVILAHGWPESWYSWRHQIKALADAGYHAVAPDMRGYGGTDAPSAIADYDIHHLAGDVVSIIDAMGEEKAHLIGHDWGAVVSWNAVHMYPDRFRSLSALSVPYGGRGSAAPTTILKKIYGDNFYYMLYFQEPGVAEAEFDADPRAILSRLYRSPDSPSLPPTLTDPKMSAGGWVPRLGELKDRPDWLSAADLDYYVQQFQAAGFRGGINYYRNLDRNWETTADLEGVTIDIPVKFIAGEQDVVLGGRTAEQLDATMRNVCTDFRGVTLLPNTGHWVQQEEADAVNEALVSFIGSIRTQ